MKGHNNPFTSYNVGIFSRARTQLRSLLLFENHRFGLANRKENTLTIAHQGHVEELKETVITIGRLDEETDFASADITMSVAGIV